MARSRKKRQTQIVKYLSLSSLAAAVLFFAWLWWLQQEASAIRYREFGIAIPAAYTIHGIDVSRYQQRIDWEAVKAMNVEGIQLNFVFIKATEGTNLKDEQFERNWRKAKSVGLTRGAYHYFIPTRSGREQAAYFLKQVQLESGDLPPVLDVEQHNGVPVGVLRKEVREWLELVELACGAKPILYASSNFYEKWLGATFDDYTLWIAHYLQPEAPRTRRNWIFWQHSERGRVNGIKGFVDFNVFRADSVRFSQLLLK